MHDRFAELRRTLEESVWRDRGHTPPAMREAAATRRDVPPELAALVDKIHRHAHKVTDEDIATLRARFSDDELYELIVSAALGAAAARLDAGLGALAATDDEEGAARATARG
jgi:alkylhydroperoxidase family enzyme